MFLQKENIFNFLPVSPIRIHEIYKYDWYNCLILVRHHARIANEPYEAAKDSHAIVICTEWDEFSVSSINNISFLDFSLLIYLEIRL